jgi:hypothetical protein
MSLAKTRLPRFEACRLDEAETRTTSNRLSITPASHISNSQKESSRTDLLACRPAHRIWQRRDRLLRFKLGAWNLPRAMVTARGGNGFAGCPSQVLPR